MKRQKTRLAVPRETIRSLGELDRVVGGLITNKTIECPSVTASCGSECGITCIGG